MMSDLKKAFPDLISDDAGWKMDAAHSLPERGIRDYYRRITTERKPTKEELSAISIWLGKNKCPGWTPISIGNEYCRSLNGHLPKTEEEEKLYPFGYTFRTTMDSSD
mgnify:FL=1